MIIKILKYLGALFVVMGATYFLHDMVLVSKGLTLQFSLVNLYLINILLSFCTYVIIRMTNDHLPNQVGYAFLTTVMVKPGVLILVFGKYIFEAETFKMFERVTFMVPFFISLLIEVISIHGILKSQEETTE